MTSNLQDDQLQPVSARPFEIAKTLVSRRPPAESPDAVQARASWADTNERARGSLGSTLVTPSGRSGEIPRFTRSAAPTAIARAVRTHGCAIVEQLCVPEVLAAGAELRAFLDRVPTCRGSFAGYRTRRTMRLVVKSKASHALILDDLVQSTLSALFEGEAYHHQLHFTEAVRIEPGEAAQSLHRDDGTFPFRHPSPPSVINTIWAVDDYTPKNGATRVVPFSHLWDDERRASPDEAIPVVMPKGSVLIMDGALHHGGGENRSDASRTALLIGYSLGWLRPLENPQLAVPPAAAKHLPPALSHLLGYKSHGYLGTFEGTQPSAAWLEPLPDVLPGEDLFTPELEALRIRRR